MPIAVHKVRDPSRALVVAISLVDERGRPLRLDVPAHHLEAFVQGGPLAAATAGGQIIGTTIVVDGTDYFVT